MSRTVTLLFFIILFVVALARHDEKNLNVGSRRSPHRTTTTVSATQIRREESAPSGLEFIAKTNDSSKPLLPLELRRGGASTAAKTMTARQMEAYK